MVKAALLSCAARFTTTRMLDEYADRIYGVGVGARSD
jgi:hypothetical protein